jgi:cation diffusion facilitator CzcD-associated flavoprotein CzcO
MYLAYRKEVETELNIRFKAVSQTCFWASAGGFLETY